MILVELKKNPGNANVIRSGDKNENEQCQNEKYDIAFIVQQLWNSQAVVWNQVKCGYNCIKTYFRIWKNCLSYRRKSCMINKVGVFIETNIKNPDDGFEYILEVEYVLFSHYTKLVKKSISMVSFSTSILFFTTNLFACFTNLVQNEIGRT